MVIVSVFPYLDRQRYHPERRLVLYTRDDGMFGMKEEYYYQTATPDGELSDEGWSSSPTLGLFETSRAARAEILSRIAKAEDNNKVGLLRSQPVS